MVADREKMSTPVGDCAAYVVEYTAGNYMKTRVWYCKDIGIVRKVDEVVAEELGIISMVGK